MTRHAAVWLIAVSCAGLMVSACSNQNEATTAEPILPIDATDESCELCGMYVHEQPASRAQVVHRDGHRAYLCAIGELPPYLDVPSPHGKIEAVFVEVLTPAEGPSTVATNPHPWLNAHEVFYVVGGPSRPVMSESVLVYANRHEAEQIGKSFGGRTLGWDQLLTHLNSDQQGSP